MSWKLIVMEEVEKKIRWEEGGAGGTIMREEESVN